MQEQADSLIGDAAFTHCRVSIARVIHADAVLCLIARVVNVSWSFHSLELERINRVSIDGQYVFIACSVVGDL